MDHGNSRLGPTFSECTLHIPNESLSLGTQWRILAGQFFPCQQQNLPWVPLFNNVPWWRRSAAQEPLMTGLAECVIWRTGYVTAGIQTAVVRDQSSFGITASGAALRRYGRTLFKIDSSPKGGKKHHRTCPGDLMPWDSKRVCCFVLLDRYWGIVKVPGFPQSEPKGEKGWFRKPNLITELSGWRTPDQPHRTQEPVPDRRNGTLPSLRQTQADPQPSG